MLISLNWVKGQSEIDIYNVIVGSQLLFLAFPSVIQLLIPYLP